MKLLRSRELVSRLISSLRITSTCTSFVILKILTLSGLSQASNMAAPVQDSLSPVLLVLVRATRAPGILGW